MLLLVPRATNRANISAIVGAVVRFAEVASRADDVGATGSEHAANGSDAPSMASDAIRLM
jgi:hypothetical protein